jgi:hypothetical protein
MAGSLLELELVGEEPAHAEPDERMPVDHKTARSLAQLGLRCVCPMSWIP